MWLVQRATGDYVVDDIDNDFYDYDYDSSNDDHADHDYVVMI